MRSSGKRACRDVLRTLGAACLLAAAPASLSAQSGGLFLLAPFGSRAVGSGEAVAADTALGTEAMWWNPAALARLNKRELAVHNSATIVANSNMLAFSVPSRVLGTLAASAYLVDYGDQENTDQQGNILGTITNRNYQLAVSYATPVGKAFSAGLTYKFVMLRFACTGICGSVPVLSGSTSALDLGAQYVLPTRLPITVGLSVRNLGPALQIRDAEQADPLPRVIQGGVRTRLPIKALADREASLEVSGDLMSASALGGAAAGLGAVLGYKDVVFLRGGYKMQEGQGRGPSIGFGIQRGAFGLDIARRFDAFSSSLVGQPPTYVTLRTRF